MGFLKSYRIFVGIIFTVSTIALAGNANAINLTLFEAADAHQLAVDTLYSGEPRQVTSMRRVYSSNDGGAVSIFQVVAHAGGDEDDYFIIICADGEMTISRHHPSAMEIADSMESSFWGGGGGGADGDGGK